MKEPVRRTNHPWMVGVCVAAIAAAYFFLLGNSNFPEPGPNLTYDIETYAKVDQVETRYEETGLIVPDLEEPEALAVGPDGRLYVAGLNAVAVFGKDDTEVARFETNGAAKCIAVADDGTIFLGFPEHVEVVGKDGAVQAVWPEIGPRAFLTSIAVLEDDVYVADAGNRVVYRFDREGNLLARIGEIDLEEDIPGIEVPSPYLDLAVNDEGNLWVVNPGRLGLERYRADGSIVTSWYKPSVVKLEGFSGCCNPTHIAFSNDGKLITSEKGLVRIKVYDVTYGEFEELVAGSKLFPREQSLKDLVVDAGDRILVLDPRINAIRIFERKEDDHGTTGQST